MEEYSTLQTSATRNIEGATSNNHEHPKVHLDFGPARSAIEWLDVHFTLPTFDIEAVLGEQAHWLPQCLDWIRGDWYSWDGPLDCVRIYYDGSFHPKSGSAGSASAAFVRQDGVWKFAGALSVQQRTPKFESYTAELLASLISSKQAFDLVKTNVEVFATTPTVEFMYDSLSVGKQAEGSWQAKQDPTTCHVIRSLLRLIEKRWKVKCQHFHVPGHQGDPGNELVDTLANCAAQGRPLQDWDPFLTHVTQNSFAQALEWTWAFFTSHLGEAWNHDQLVLPAAPATEPCCDTALPFAVAEQPTVVQGEVRLQLLTCNVLTLLPGPEKTHPCGVGGPTRLQTLIAQMQAEKIQIFALQETRLRTTLRLNNEDYFLIHAPANARGHFGIMLGFAKTQAFAFQADGKPHPNGWFESSDFTIIAAEPRLLVLRVRNAFIRCVIIAAHAPHSGASVEDIEEYWKHVDQTIPSKYDNWPKLLLADSNCRFGDAPNKHIGPHGAELSCPKSDAFSHFVAAQQIFLPATFAELHQGPTGTWRHPNGTWTRNDIIGVPLDWPLLQCHSWTDVDLDFSLSKDDHRPARVTLAWCTQDRSYQSNAIKVKKCPSHFCPEALQQLLTEPSNRCDWDVHTHFGQIQLELARCTRFTNQLHFRQPLKSHMSAQTWELVCRKKKWRANLARCQRLQRRTTIHLVFAAWRHSVHEISFHQEIRTFDDILGQLDRDVAIALFNFRCLGRQVTQASRQDDCHFYHKLATESSQWLGPNEARNFWKTLRRSLPKFRQRRQGFDPLNIEPLEDQWMSHFLQLEVGEARSPVDVLQECHRRQCQTKPAQTQLSITELPSLVQLEDVLRQAQPHKATGHDTLPSVLFRNNACDLADAFFPLLLKMMAWQQEPIAGKGGPLAVIHKKGSQYIASNYRGIMLLPTFTKRVHALLRRQLMALLGRQRPPGQLGGFNHQQVLFGSQSLQTFGRVMDNLKLTSAVLFLDLTTAFHRLVREWVSGIHVPPDLMSVLQSLEAEGLNAAEMCDRLHLPSLLERLKAPPSLIQLIQDIHASTWMMIGGPNNFAQTKRGTRPGSPLADCVFHILMADILHQLQEWINEQVEYQCLLAEFDIPGGFIAWADDLAVPWATHQANEMPGGTEEDLGICDATI